MVGSPDGNGTDDTVAPLVALINVALLVGSSGSVTDNVGVEVEEIDENSNELCVRKEKSELTEVVIDNKVVVISPEDVLEFVPTVVLLVGNVIDVALVTVAVVELPMSVMVSVPDVIDAVLFVSGAEVIVAVLLSPDEAVVYCMCNTH